MVYLVHENPLHTALVALLNRFTVGGMMSLGHM